VTLLKKRLLDGRLRQDLGVLRPPEIIGMVDRQLHRCGGKPVWTPYRTTARHDDLSQMCLVFMKEHLQIVNKGRSSPKHLVKAIEEERTSARRFCASTLK
jgi:hypothetical protein